MGSVPLMITDIQEWQQTIIDVPGELYCHLILNIFSKFAADSFFCHN